MNYCGIKKTDIANGPGVRVSLSVSGCRNRCPGCFQPETWDFAYGDRFTKETEDEIIRTVDPKELVDVESVTIRTDLPDKERVAGFLRQIKNPYCYLYRGMVVKVSFSGKRRLEDCLKDCLFTNI